MVSANDFVFNDDSDLLCFLLLTHPVRLNLATNLSTDCLLGANLSWYIWLNKPCAETNDCVTNQ